MAMMKRRTGTVVGVFTSSANAQNAIRELRELGFTENQIGVVSQDHICNVRDAEIGDNEVEDGAVAGAATGLGIGTLWGVAVLAGAVPGIGAAIAGGTLGVLLTSAMAGAATFGLAGALVGLGVSAEDAAFYEDEFNAGHTIVTVRAGDRADEAWSVLEQSEAYEHLP